MTSLGALRHGDGGNVYQNPIWGLRLRLPKPMTPWMISLWQFRIPGLLVAIGANRHIGLDEAP